MQQKLEKHLSPLTWDGVIANWHKGMISAGKEWESEIDANLKTADIILVLISSEFTASHYHWNVLAKQAMEMHRARTASVITILLSPVDNYWKIAFPNVKVLPDGERAITQWKPYDKAFVNITEGIRVEVEKLTDPTFAIKKSLRQINAGVKSVVNHLVNSLFKVASFTLFPLTKASSRSSRFRRQNKTAIIPLMNPVIIILSAVLLASQTSNLLRFFSAKTLNNHTLISKQKANDTGWIWIGQANNTSGTLSVGERLLRPSNTDLFPSIDPPVIPSPGSIVTVKYRVNLRKEKSLSTEQLYELQSGEKLVIVKVEPLAKVSQNSPYIKVRAQVRKCNQTCNK
ncbi:MAG: hypothetical protein PUP92_35150 [Rhizonema sp. PD38]|nr:hypothetical protein [Rhizonema sp. PD38]